jgi:hypothetical protein
MPRRKVADMTLAQRTTYDNDKFRTELYAQHLEAAKAEARELAKARKANEQ